MTRRRSRPEQMERWAADFDSWDVCDQACGNLFDRTPFAYAKAVEWSGRAGGVRQARRLRPDGPPGGARQERPRRAGSRPSCPLSSGRPPTSATSSRRRSTGRCARSASATAGSNELAIQTAREISKFDSTAARWVAADALRELTGEKVQQRFK